MKWTMAIAISSRISGSRIASVAWLVGGPGRTVGGKITVSFAADQAAWLLSVSDNGSGMPVGNKRGRPGLGTGIVEALAKQLNATVTVSGTEGSTRAQT